MNYSAASHKVNVSESKILIRYDVLNWETSIKELCIERLTEMLWTEACGNLALSLPWEQCICIYTNCVHSVFIT